MKSGVVWGYARGDGDYSAREKQQFYIMKDFMAEEVETDANSPDKRFTLSRNRPSPSLPHHLHDSHAARNSKLSLTEQSLYSRGIVREVMRTHQHKTVKHDIHRIHHDTSLYATPKPNIAAELKFQSIPPKNKLYSSVCSAKIHRISSAMQAKQRRIHYTSHKEMTEGAQASRAGNDNIEQKSGEPNISVSGLVTYKFNSVIAQRSLGFGQIDRIQDMKNDLSTVRHRRECARAREKSILSRASKKKQERHLQTEEAILSNPLATTDQYLTSLLRSQQENAIIYNEKANKLRFIKELMQEDGLGYDAAHHIVQKIEEIHAPAAQKRRYHETLPANVDEEEEMRLRRVCVRRGKVLLRYQTFVD